MPEDWGTFSQKEKYRAELRDASKERDREFKKAFEKERFRQRETLTRQNADMRATGTLEAEREKTNRELQKIRLNVEAKAGFLKVEQDFHRENRERDFEDEVRRTDLRAQEYDFCRSIDRQNERSLIYEERRTSREKLKHLMLEKALAHKIEKDRMTHAHRLEKGRMTHETDEKIRLIYAIGQIKREFGELNEQELKKIIDRYEAEWEEEIKAQKPE